MSNRTRMFLFALLAFLLALPFGLYWLADAWLESAGGRRLIEQELSNRLGMSVRIEGEFDLMLFPAIGVWGTELKIGGSEGGAAGSGSNPREALVFASSREIEVSVALKPLFHRRVVVEWIRLTGGEVYPDRYLPPPVEEGAAAMKLPEIRELALRDFQLVLGAGEQEVLHLKELEVRDFADARQAPFSLEIENLVATEGWLLWDTSLSKILFGDLRVISGGQEMSGEACLRLQDPWSFQADLAADTFDFDAFRNQLPDMGEGGDELPLEIRARLAVDELRASGVTARGVVLNLGDDPSCD